MAKYVTINTKVKKIVRRGPPGPASTTPDPTFDSITLNPAAAVPASPVQGQAWFDPDELTWTIRQNGTDLQVGQETQANVRDDDTVAITDGTPAMVKGSIGASGRITVERMDGTDPLNAKLLFGLATEQIEVDEDGKITNFGKIRNINTTGTAEGEVWADGDILWISDTTVGSLTKVEPPRTSLGMPVALVVNAAVSGTLFVRLTSIDEHLLVTPDQRDALDSSNSADALNPFFTHDDLLTINAQGWDINALGSVTTTLIMDAAAYSEFTATLPLTGTTTTISFSNMPAIPTAWPMLHLITGATFDAPVWTDIDATGITLIADTTHNIGFQPVKTTSAWKIVAVLMHSEDDA
jgi:hypothetical protein